MRCSLGCIPERAYNRQQIYGENKIGPLPAALVGMNRFYTIEGQKLVRAYAYTKIGIAWPLGLFAFWIFANEPDIVRNFAYLYWPFVGAIKMLGYSGWCDFGKSKGYKWYTNMFGFIPVLGPILLIFLDDKWFEQPVPKLKAPRRLVW